MPIPTLTPGVGKATAKEWHGELLSMQEGAFYLATSLQAFPKTKQSRSLNGNIQILLVNTETHQRFIFMHHHSNPIAPPIEVFKLPVGTYKVKAMAMTDNSGQIRKLMAPKNLPLLQIKPITLTNFGLIVLHPKGRIDLQVDHFSTKALYSPDEKDRKAQFSAVIDSRTGKIQKVLGGKAVFEAAKSSYSNHNEMRRSFGHTQKIAMFLKLNLYENNRLAKDFVQTLQLHDPDIRNCYVSRLNQGINVKGNVIFNFKIAPSSGSMQPLSYSGGTLKDAPVIKCLYYQLGQIQFPFHTAIRGQLIYQFANQHEN